MSDFEYNTVGFVGLGAMGYCMTEQLVQKLPATTKICAFDVVQSVLERLSSESKGKVIPCSSAREVAEKSDVIVTMVPEGSHVRTVFLDSKDGILKADVSKKLLIDCSTIDTASNHTVRKAIEEQSPSTYFYDAPVSGGPIGARKGTLTIMLGCSEDDEKLPELRHILGMMGKTIIPCGGPSLGLVAKLSNNYLSGLCAIATSEAMNMGMRSGLDPKILSKIFSSSTAQNCINDKWNPVPGVCPEAPSSNGYQGGFKVQLMRKDFALAVGMAEGVGAKLALGQAGLDVYTGASNDEQCRDLDSRVVYRYLGGKE